MKTAGNIEKTKTLEIDFILIVVFACLIKPAGDMITFFSVFLQYFTMPLPIGEICDKIRA